MRVQRIGFTPLKGGRHVAHESVQLTLDGPVGDRGFCLVDPVRARVLRTVENPTLVRHVARLEDGHLCVDLPTGTVEGIPVGTSNLMTVDYWGRTTELEILDGPWAAAYSRFLGYDVVLARAASGEVVYGAPVSLVTTEALRWLGDQVGHPVEAERFRATFTVDSGPGARRTEQGWIGRRLLIGEAEVEVVSDVPRCAVVDLDPVTGERDLPVLKALGPEVTFGVDAVVARPGRVRLGDEVVA